MNKGAKRLVSVLLAVLVLAALGAGALAEGDTYTVRLFAGSGGLDTEAGQAATFADGSYVMTVQCSYGDPFPFSVDGLNESMTYDGKYYVKCIRPSGHDNNTVESTPLTVTGDADYVVAYGIRGQLVPYTVRYVIEGTETDLAPRQTFYGNVGDKPVVSYIYIDGYEPQAYNITWTLTESNPIVKFEYTPVVTATPEPAAQPTPYVYTEGAAEEPEAPVTEEIGGGAAPAGGGEAVVPAEEPAAAPEAQPETANIEDEQTPLDQGPAEIIDLDETPAGGTPHIRQKPKTELQQARDKVRSDLYVAVGLLGAILIVIAALAVTMVRKKRAKQ